MAIWSLTQERVQKLLSQIGDKEHEIDDLLKLTAKDLWHKELDDFIAEWRFQLDDDMALTGFYTEDRVIPVDQAAESYCESEGIELLFEVDRGLACKECLVVFA